MIINYLHESGPFGSYKSRSQESIRKAAEKDLEHIAKTALLDKLHTEIGILLKEYIDNKNKIYPGDIIGLSIVGKNGYNKKVIYSYGNDLENTKPVFRLVLEKNTIVVIISCMPLSSFNNNKIVINGYGAGLIWIDFLKEFLNSNIDRITTETGVSFKYDGFDVKLELDPDILDNDGRVNVRFMSIIHTNNIDKIQKIVDKFYKQNIRIKTDTLVFNDAMSSNEMYQQYIKRFPNLVKSTGFISFDMEAMKTFDLENLHITSVLADPQSDVEVYYDLRFDYKVSKTSIEGIKNFIHNEYNMTLDEFKEIAYKNKGFYDRYYFSPEDVSKINVSYRYENNNSKDLEIKGTSSA